MRFRWYLLPLLLTVAAACLAVASAVTLGGANSRDLAAWDEPATRCATAVDVAATGDPFTTLTVSVYDASCVGKTFHVTIFDATGSPLADGSVLLLPGSTSVNLSGPVTVGDIDDAAATIAGLGVTVNATFDSGPSMFDADILVTSDTWWNWCADITITTESVDPVEWSYEIVLDGSQSERLNNDPSKPLYPLSGVPYNIWSASPGLPSSWNATTKTVSVHGASWYQYVSASTPHTWGLCVNRTDPPPPADVECTITGGNDWGAGFQMNFRVTTTSSTATHWTCEFTFPDPSTSPALPAGTVTQVFNGAWCFTGGTLTVSSNQTWMMVDDNSPYNGGFQGAIPGAGGPNGNGC